MADTRPRSTRASRSQAKRGATKAVEKFIKSLDLDDVCDARAEIARTLAPIKGEQHPR